MIKQFGKKLIFFLCCGAVYLIFLACLFEYRANTELNQARDFRAQENYKAADIHYFQALNWYLPWGSSQAAANELINLAKDNLAKGNDYEAYQSSLRLRGALLASRSFYIPRKDLIVQTNDIISLYLAQIKVGPTATPEKTQAQVKEYYLLYSLDKIPGQFWYFLSVLGFFLWVISIFLVVKAYFSSSAPLKIKLKLNALRLPLLFFIIGYCLWVYSMSVA
jgi:hypothetical protein